MRKRIFFKRIDGHRSHISGTKRVLGYRKTRNLFEKYAELQVKTLLKELKVSPKDKLPQVEIP